MQCAICRASNAESEGYCHTCGSPLIAEAVASTAEAGLSGGVTLYGGAYVIGKVLGQGGFGITYLASDVRLRRSVTIKEYFPPGCVRRGTNVVSENASAIGDFESGRRQFLEEACVLAQFHQPSIVEVHASFEENGTAYTAMEFIPGRTLAEVLRDRGGVIPETLALGYIRQVGEALQAVHEAGLLHRDVKPHNVMVTEFGRVVLIDFGTARHYVSSGGGEGSVTVTPGYAPLEQYAEGAKRGAYSDIYSLAATLYHLLTGQPPPPASDRAKGVEVAPIRQYTLDVSDRVQQAVMNGLQMAVARRPQTMRQFLDQLSLAHLPGGRAPTIPTSLPTPNAATPNGPGGVGNLAPADLPRTKAHQLLIGMGLTVVTIVGIGVVAAQNTGSASGTDTPTTLAYQPPAAPPAEVTSSSSVKHLLQITTTPALLKGHQAPINALAFSSDGAILASGSDDKTIRWWNPATKELEKTLPPLTSRVTQLAFSSDDRWFAALTGDETLHLYNGRTGKPRAVWSQELPYTSISFVPGQDRIVTTSAAGSELWDLRRGQRLQQLYVAGSSARVSDDGKILAGGANDGKLGIWNLAKPDVVSLHTDAPVLDIANAEKSDRMAVLLTDHSVQDWLINADVRQIEGRLPAGTGDEVTSFMTLAPNGQELALETKAGEVNVYWAKDLSNQFSLSRDVRANGAMCFSPDGTTLVTGDVNNDIQIWRIQLVG